MTSTTHPASRVCSVSKLAGSGFFDGPFKFAVDGKIEHGKVAWPSSCGLETALPVEFRRVAADSFQSVGCA